MSLPNTNTPGIRSAVQHMGALQEMTGGAHLGSGQCTVELQHRDARANFPSAMAKPISTGRAPRASYRGHGSCALHGGTAPDYCDGHSPIDLHASHAVANFAAPKGYTSPIPLSARRGLTPGLIPSDAHDGRAGVSS